MYSYSKEFLPASRESFPFKNLIGGLIVTALTNSVYGNLRIDLFSCLNSFFFFFLFLFSGPQGRMGCWNIDWERKKREWDKQRDIYTSCSTQKCKISDYRLTSVILQLRRPDCIHERATVYLYSTYDSTFSQNLPPVARAAYGQFPASTVLTRRKYNKFSLSAPP